MFCYKAASEIHAHDQLFIAKFKKKWLQEQITLIYTVPKHKWTNLLNYRGKGNPRSFVILCVSSYLNGRLYFKATDIWSLLYRYIYMCFSRMWLQTQSVIIKSKSYFKKFPTAKLARYKAKIYMFLFSIMNTFTKHKYFNIY